MKLTAKARFDFAITLLLFIIFRIEYVLIGNVSGKWFFGLSCMVFACLTAYDILKGETSK